MRFCVLSSGSKGNATWVEAEGSALLVDAGLSGKEIERRMAIAGLSPEKLSAILVSHEHRDHISGVGIMARRYNLPVYINKLTLAQCQTHLKKVRVNLFRTGTEFDLGPISIHPFSISHDAADPVGFIFGNNGDTLGLATDLGTATKLVRARLSKCKAMVIESNHDPEMLINGPYHWDLKRRVQGRRGHLSNDAAAELLNDVVHQGLKRVVLAHLSEVNNEPELALARASFVLNSCQSRFHLEVACQDKPSRVFEI
ncbi:MAG: MBL fold metallo-hydrolase [Deltaproteobacteria bacterium]|nr:MBL fold metallo-hydrolase [Deltaproteobacteria bacterium]MBW2322354.1 MBL fold metallo-hydrolase [Deltaproteobacteria bacterium]